MNDKPTVDVKTLPILTKFIYTIGQLPTSYLMSMTYEEQVVWLCNYLETEIIPALNTNGEAVEELQTLYELLRTYVNESKETIDSEFENLENYVNNYFNNLDVQDEIDNKIDELIENGDFIQIISSYLGYLTPEMYGAVGDNVADDTTAIQTALSQAGSTGLPLIFKKTTYKTTDSLVLPEKINLDGKGATIYATGDYPILKSTDGVKLQSSSIRGINLRGTGDSEDTNNIGIYFAGIYCNFEDIQISYCYKGIEQYSDGIAGNQVTCKFNNLNIRYITNNAIELGSNSNGVITDGWLNNINIGCGGIGLKIGSAKGYFISNIHFWGNETMNISLRDTAYSFINKIYSEGFVERAFSIHLLGDVYVDNCSLNLTTNNSTMIYFARSTNPVNDIYGINISNIIATCNNDELYGTFIDCENRSFPNVKMSNIITSSNLTYSTNEAKFPNPNKSYTFQQIVTCDVTDGNSVIIPIPLAITLNNYYKCKITLYGRRYDYSNFNASAVYECIISQGGSNSNANISLLELNAPTGFNENPSVTYSKGDAQITLSFKTNNAYPLCIFVEWFKED